MKHIIQKLKRGYDSLKQFRLFPSVRNTVMTVMVAGTTTILSVAMYGAAMAVFQEPSHGPNETNHDRGSLFEMILGTGYTDAQVAADTTDSGVPATLSVAKTASINDKLNYMISEYTE